MFFSLYLSPILIKDFWRSLDRADIGKVKLISVNNLYYPKESFCFLIFPWPLPNRGHYWYKDNNVERQLRGKA